MSLRKALVCAASIFALVTELSSAQEDRGVYAALRANDLDQLKKTIALLGVDFKGTPVVAWYLSNVFETDGKVLEYLLASGGDPNLSEPGRVRPIVLGLGHGRDTIHLLLDHGVELNFTVGRSPVESGDAANHNGNTDVVAHLLEAANKSLSGSEEYRFARVASALNDFDIERALIAAGMRVDIDASYPRKKETVSPMSDEEWLRFCRDMGMSCAPRSQTNAASSAPYPGTQEITEQPHLPLLRWMLNNRLWASLGAALSLTNGGTFPSDATNDVLFDVASGRIDSLKKALVSYKGDTRELLKVAIDARNRDSVQFLLALNARDTSVSTKMGHRISPFGYAVNTDNTQIARLLVPGSATSILAEVSQKDRDLRINRLTGEVNLGNLKITDDLFFRLLGFHSSESPSWVYQRFLYSWSVDYGSLNLLSNALSVVLGRTPAYAHWNPVVSGMGYETSSYVERNSSDGIRAPGLDKLPWLYRR